MKEINRDEFNSACLALLGKEFEPDDAILALAARGGDDNLQLYMKGKSHEVEFLILSAIFGSEDFCNLVVAALSRSGMYEFKRVQEKSIKLGKRI
jgi:hypothetical protein